jgi:flagellar assembly protein FliH
MSSSPSRAPEARGAAAAQYIATATPPAAPSQAPAVSPFLYGEVAPHGGGSKAPANGDAAPSKGNSDAAAASQLAEREAQARQQGRQQAEADARAKFEEQLGRERQVVAKAVADFARDRAVFYRKLEDAAVRLALSIARKVLHREAQVDPLLLMGIVRVALEKIEGATAVTLVVNPKQAADWRAYFAGLAELATPPEVVEDAAMPSDQCGLRTAMGTTELGMEMQLKEIEKGLMDLLAARPQDQTKNP